MFMPPCSKSLISGSAPVYFEVIIFAWVSVSVSLYF